MKEISVSWFALGRRVLKIAPVEEGVESDGETHTQRQEAMKGKTHTERSPDRDREQDADIPKGEL